MLWHAMTGKVATFSPVRSLKDTKRCGLRDTSCVSRSASFRPSAAVDFFSSQPILDFPSVTRSTGDISATSITSMPSSISLSNEDLSTMAATEFDPILPSTSTLLGMGVIVLLCVVTGWVWANVVVPNARTNLAKSKRDGPVKDYLEELQQSTPASSTDMGTVTSNNIDSSTTLEADVGRSGAVSGTETSIDVAAPARQPTTTDDRALERWLFTDWLTDNKSAASKKPGRQKEPALPILKKAKWNSGDNPILVATALIILGVVATSITERVASFL